jgi:2-keto-4-pentenoate hydratase/2-oxohepta-3-ene-1,7-dioic acid hydratase in catechol pathway
MRVIRLVHGGLPYFATWENDETARLWTKAPWEGGAATDRFVPLARTTRLAPVAPSKIVAVGRNYAAHAKELGNDVPKEPLLFLKPPSALVSHETQIELPSDSKQIEHEGEIGIVFRSRLRDADLESARRGIFGVTCVNDVTARDLQRSDVQFTRAKGFDTFCPVGPWIETDVDLDALSVTCRVNGKTRQHGSVHQMAFPITTLIAFVSRVMTIEPGDLLLTGTPEGVGPLEPGDRVEVEIPGVGILANPVVRRAPRA